VPCHVTFKPLHKAQPTMKSIRTSPSPSVSAPFVQVQCQVHEGRASCPAPCDLPKRPAATCQAGAQDGWASKRVHGQHPRHADCTTVCSSLLAGPFRLPCAAHTKEAKLWQHGHFNTHVYTGKLHTSTPCLLVQHWLHQPHTAAAEMRIKPQRTALVQTEQGLESTAQIQRMRCISGRLPGITGLMQRSQHTNTKAQQQESIIHAVSQEYLQLHTLHKLPCRVRSYLP
jgi:hypothetical protein